MRNMPALLSVSLCAACTVARPSTLPSSEPWIVAVKSAGIPKSMPWYSHFAEHTWVDAKLGEEENWLRAEVRSRSSGAVCGPISAAEARNDWRWGDEAVRVHAVIVGERAQRIAQSLEAATARIAPRYDGGYVAWPGPNSNTFVRELTFELPELAFVFDHNALGKDFTWARVGPTASRTGLELNTWPVGVALALGEGVELHLLQLTFALRVWPPRLAMPFLPAIPWERAPGGGWARATKRAASIHAPVEAGLPRGGTYWLELRRLDSDELLARLPFDVAHGATATLTVDAASVR